MDFFHAGMRELQDRYEGRAVPDRLAAKRMRTTFSETDREFIETSAFFFLATATPKASIARSRAASLDLFASLEITYWLGPTTTATECTEVLVTLCETHGLACCSYGSMACFLMVLLDFGSMGEEKLMSPRKRLRDYTVPSALCG